MTYEQDIQQSRSLLDNFNCLDEKTRDKLAKGVEWLAFLQNLAKENDDDRQPAQAAT